jgi:hypothetical protein
MAFNAAAGGIGVALGIITLWFFIIQGNEY